MSSAQRSQWLGLIGWLVVVFAAATVGAIASTDAPWFYAQLDKPAWTPPATVFGPVWSVLYVLMGVAVWQYWRTASSSRTVGLVLFGVQLVANALWSWLFFAWNLGAAAAIEVLILLALILATMVVFWRVSRLAGVLLVPYALWVAFASVLTWVLWLGNPALL